MGRGKRSSRSISVTGQWNSLPVLNKAPPHSLAKSQTWTLIDGVIFFMEFNVSFAKHNYFYTVQNPANSTEGIINTSYNLIPLTALMGLLLLRTYCILLQQCGVIPTWYPQQCGVISTWYPQQCGVIPTWYPQQCGVIPTWYPQQCGVIPTWYPPFYVSLTMHLGIILINNQLDAQFLFAYVYFTCLHVSRTHVLIISRINCINMTLGICHSENKWIV
jgi:hypothetical protein